MPGREIEPVKPVSAVEYYGDERASFDRLDGETPTEHEWLMHYCRTSYRRSYKDTAQYFGVSRDSVQRAASKHGWTLRVRAYQDYEDARRLADIENRQLEVRSAHAEMFKDARDKLTAAIALVDPFRMNPRDIPAWMEVVMKGERLTVGINDAPKKVDISVTGQVEISAAEMSPAERQEVLSSIMAEIAKRQAEVSALEAANIVEAEIVDGEG